MRRRAMAPVVGLAVFSVLAVQVGDAWARARSGGSGGRGSRSYSAPVRPSPAQPTTPSSPSRSVTQPTPASPAAPLAPPRPSFFGGLMGGIAGFALGGLLGSLLFGGLGRGFGIGFMDILILGGVIMLVVMFLRRRKEAERPAYATAGAPTVGAPESRYGTGIGGTATMEMPAGGVDKERGIGHIRQMDAGFDPAAFAQDARTMFVTVQSALVMRDMGRLRDRLTPEIYIELQSQCDRLRGARQSNHVEKIDVRQAEVTEAWQETGQDYVTVQLAGALLDYVVDDASGRLVDGSKTEAQDFEEYWTFTRRVGPNPWRLSSIQTA